MHITEIEIKKYSGKTVLSICLLLFLCVRIRKPIFHNNMIESIFYYLNYLIAIKLLFRSISIA